MSASRSAFFSTRRTISRDLTLSLALMTALVVSVFGTTYQIYYTRQEVHDLEIEAAAMADDVTGLRFPACDAVDALTLSSLGLGDQPRFRFGFGFGFAFDRLGVHVLLVPAFDHVCPGSLEWAHAKLSQCDLGLGIPLAGVDNLG